MMRGGGMGGGMMRGMRGTSADSMFAPTNDNLTDEDVVGRVYDNRVVARLYDLHQALPQVRPHRPGVVADLRGGERRDTAADQVRHRLGHRRGQRKPRPRDWRGLHGHHGDPLPVQPAAIHLHIADRAAHPVRPALRDVQPPAKPVQRVLPPDAHRPHHVPDAVGHTATARNLRAAGPGPGRTGYRRRDHHPDAGDRLAVGAGVHAGGADTDADP